MGQYKYLRWSGQNFGLVLFQIIWLLQNVKYILSVCKSTINLNISQLKIHIILKRTSFSFIFRNSRMQVKSKNNSHSDVDLSPMKLKINRLFSVLLKNILDLMIRTAMLCLNSHCDLVTLPFDLELNGIKNCWQISLIVNSNYNSLTNSAQLTRL